MQPIPFTAATAEEAVMQIREKLGPEAVVLNVRPLPPNGLARLWQKPMIEVIAYLPDAPALTPEPQPITEALAEFRQQLDEIRQQVVSRPAREESESFQVDDEPEIPATPAHLEAVELDGGNWRVGAVLQKSGLLPLHTQMVLDALIAEHGENPPATLGQEIALARDVLAKFWRKAAPVKGHSMHALVGPAGSGKTTCLSKWLTQSVLMRGRLARVWRLDGAAANMAESLSVYCEILGVPSERMWTGNRAPMGEDIGFIDLPGIDWRKGLAVKELAGQIKQLSSPRVHLVLNGAYEISVLLAQVRAFSELPIDSLIITHLDEESRWGKIWNLVLGTNYSIRGLSTGQNIPGDFCEASPEMIFSRQFPRK
jgi:flagellar biosynthesis protein FlhF